MLNDNQIDTPRCPSCDSSNKKILFSVYDHEYQTTEQKFPLNICQNCELIYLSPRPNKHALEIIYPSKYNNYHTKMHSKISYVQKVSQYIQSRRWKKYIDRYFKLNPPANVLDVGCGDGFILDCIKAKFPKIKTYGIDPNSEATKIAGKVHEVYCGFVEDFKTDMKFDLITCSNVIEHVEDPLNFLKNFQRFMHDTTLVIIDTPNINCLQYKLFKKHWGGIHAPRHWVLFNNKTFQMITARANLQCLDIQGMPVNIFWIWSIHSYLYQFPTLRNFADRFFNPQACVGTRSFYYLILMTLAEFLERVTGFLGLGLGQQRGIFQLKALKNLETLRCAQGDNERSG